MNSSTLVPPEISVIVPVLNEGEDILHVLRGITAAAKDIPYEVIVVDGDPQGATIQFLPDNSKIVRGIVSSSGRGCQMNAGAAIAQGEILLFLHADTQLPANALSHISQVVQSVPPVAAGAFDLDIHSPHWSLKWVGRIASIRSRLTRIPYGDQAIFIQRQIFQNIGGYENIPIMEDVSLMRRLKRKGYGVYIFRQRVLVSPRRWEKEGILYCTLRNWTLLSLYYLGVSPHWLSIWYRPLSANKKTSQHQLSQN